MKCGSTMEIFIKSISIVDSSDFHPENNFNMLLLLCQFDALNKGRNSKIADTCSRLIDSIRAHNQKESFTKWILSKRIIVVVSGLLAFVVNKDIFYFYFFENVQLNVSSCTINNNYYRQQLVFSPFLIHWQCTAVL